MPSRQQLALRAAAVNVDETTAANANDSTLEKNVLAAEKAVTATSTATTKLPNAKHVAQSTN